MSLSLTANIRRSRGTLRYFTELQAKVKVFLDKMSFIRIQDSEIRSQLIAFLSPESCVLSPFMVYSHCITKLPFSIKAVIFDMDGVIIDSEKHWKKAELTFFGKLLPSWTKEDQQKIIGINVNDTYRILANEYGLEMTHQEFLMRVNGIALEVYRNKCNLIDGFLDLIKKLKIKNYKIALASSSLNEWINIVLERFKLRPFFDVVVSAEDINAPGKPAPDIYLFTAKKLDIPPEECIVIEDSKHGVCAAKAARMTVIGFRNGFNEKQDLSVSDIELKGFTPINNQKILGDMEMGAKNK